MTPAEYTYWQHRAALLDPLAHVFAVRTIAPPDVDTVPAGTTWYMRNSWWLRDESLSGYKFARELPEREATPLPSGMVITREFGTQGPFTCICKPELVSSDARYWTDPRGLYFTRLRRLGSGELAQHDLEVHHGAATANFPADFTYGLVIATTVFDAAWVILSGAGTVNTMSELSDSGTLPARFTRGNVLLPFARATFPGITMAGEANNDATACVSYYKLPADW